MYGPENSAREDYSTEAVSSLDREVKLRHNADRAPVERELDRFREGLSDLDELIGELARRLAVVLGPERPEPALGEVRQSEDLSPLANRLQEDADRLGLECRALRSILRRIEL